MKIMKLLRGDAERLGGIPHDSEGSTIDQCDKFLRGELSQDETDALRRNLSSQTWFSLLMTKTRHAAEAAAKVRAAEKAKLIAECLTPVSLSDTASHELAMRQLRLLAAILERTP